MFILSFEFFIWEMILVEIVKKSVIVGILNKKWVEIFVKMVIL